MRWLRFAVLIVLAAILQAGVLVNFRIRPDLLLVLLVFFAVHCNTNQAIITSFTIGFAADISMGPAMGPQIISFGLFGTLLAYLHHVITIRRSVHQGLAIFVLALLTGVAAYLLNMLKTQAASLDMRMLFWSACCSAVIGPFLFSPCAWWMRIKTNRFRRR
ncbi:MAG TPA: rod shape-determining protein MreD [Sedimentisphaerales bacterium]|nr:rod shape-determining protein MreD [Sedimentisphaerales bacterium]